MKEDARMRIRASHMDDGLVCPRRLRLDDETVPSSYMEDGTVGHAWIEKKIAAEDMQVTNERLATALDEFWDWWKKINPVPSSARVYTENSMRWHDAPTWYGTGTVDLIAIEDDTAWVVDWKFYSDTSALPPLHRHLQLYCYAVAAWMHHRVSQVIVHRVLCYHRFLETMELDEEMLRLAERALVAHGDAIYRDRDRVSPGAQCSSCPASRACVEYQRRSADIDTRELAPYTGGDFESEAQALNFLIAAPLIQKRLEEGKVAARRWVEQRNRPIADLVSSKAWGGGKPGDSIAQPILAIQALMSVVGRDGARAVQTSKTAIEAVMKSHKIPKRQRDTFFAELREIGAIVDAAPRWRWRKLKA
jgi:PD-(D/E)XK nuclease superfamily